MNLIYWELHYGEVTTYWSLDHLHALMPQLIDGPCNVHFVFLLDLLQNIVNANESTSTSNTSTVCNADNKIRKLIKYNYEIANNDFIP